MENISFAINSSEVKYITLQIKKKYVYPCTT